MRWTALIARSMSLGAESSRPSRLPDVGRRRARLILEPPAGLLGSFDQSLSRAGSRDPHDRFCPSAATRRAIALATRHRRRHLPKFRLGAAPGGPDSGRIARVAACPTRIGWRTRPVVMKSITAPGDRVGKMVGQRPAGRRRQDELVLIVRVLTDRGGGRHRPRSARVAGRLSRRSRNARADRPPQGPHNTLPWPRARSTSRARRVRSTPSVATCRLGSSPHSRCGPRSACRRSHA